MITRKQYMSKEFSYDQYYGQFVTDDVRLTVSALIGAERIKESKCEHFNDIPLKEWDSLNSMVRQHVGRMIADANGTGGISLTDCVCTAKQAAKQIRGN